MALRLKGSSSGYAEIDAAAVAGDVTLTLPSTTGTINVKDNSGTTNVGTGVNLGNPGANIFTISNTGGERLRIDATGAVSIPGNLNISGVLTYEDVTSVDAIGLSTFRDGLITKDVGIATITSSDVNGATAVDVFVYDTSKDSDGGAWRKRTSHTSWYNEEAAAGVRGSRKEFPAVAVIVAEADKVTIYDGDDPDLPMWMVINHSGAGINATTARNGVLYWGCSSASSDRTVYFIKDSYYRWWNTSAFTGYFNEPISGRNGTLTGGSGDTQVLVNGASNDVAMTVLPNAPIDDATGLPVPTIAVATDGGTSVIKDDGTVVDFNDALGSSRPVSTVVIRGNDIVHWNINNGTIQQFFDALSATSDSTNDAKYNYTAGGGHATCENVSALLRDPGDGPYYLAVRDSKSIAAGAQSGMSVFVDGIDRTFSTNSHSIFDSRVAYITSDYNTGWMHGDIKGAFLSGISTSFTYGSELVTNGTFDSDISGWTGFNSVLTHQTDAIRVADNGSYSKAYQSFTTVVGKEYLVKVVVKTVSGGAAHCNTGSQDPADVSGNDFSIISNITATGTYYDVFTANATTTYIEVWSDGVNYVEYSELSVKENAPGLLDRSVNNKGLIQYGTVTKSAVATGAELVAYSGFSASKYLQQPYNSDLDFGTGDLNITFWFKTPSGSTPTECILHRGDGGTGTWGSGKLIQIEYNSTNLIAFLAESAFTSSDSVTIPGATAANGQWSHYSLVRSGTFFGVYFNGELMSSTTSTRDVSNTSAKTWIGERPNVSRPLTTTSLALFRMSKSAPSPEQIKKMYEDEKVLFQENAKATLYGSSDAVTALAYDEVTDQLHVGTSSGRSDFQGLRRINNTTQQVQTAISAHDTFIIEQ